MLSVNAQLPGWGHRYHNWSCCKQTWYLLKKARPVHFFIAMPLIPIKFECHLLRKVRAWCPFLIHPFLVSQCWGRSSNVFHSFQIHCPSGPYDLQMLRWEDIEYHLSWCSPSSSSTTSFNFINITFLPSCKSKILVPLRTLRAKCCRLGCSWGATSLRNTV